MANPAIDKHNALYSALMGQAARYRTSVTLTGPVAEGDPGHTEIHNEIGRAMLKLRDVANGYAVTPPVVINLPDVAHVGDTGHVADHALFDTALAVLVAVRLPWETP
jgi:hypothetical protein